MTQARLMSEGAAGGGSRQDELPLPNFAQRLQPRADTDIKSKRFGVGLRLASLACLAFLAAGLVDLKQVRAHIIAVSWSTFAVMIILHVVIILLASWRFIIIARASGAKIGGMDATRLTFASTLANMLLPTSLMGDAGRIWLVRRFGLTLKSAMRVGVFDRIIGLISLGVIVLIGALLEPSILPLWIVVTTCLLLSGVAVLAYPRSGLAPPRDNMRDAVAPSTNGPIFFASMALSVAAHLVSIAIVWSFILDQDLAVTVAQLLALFPAVLLAASIPVSVGGWGTREIAAVAAFSMIGLPASMAIAMALLFGLTQVIAAGLGTATLSLFGATQAGENG
ncbi:lysylphosphatidylglycerol synthase transmembrane domain-containing protein [uncultured Roseobacter sp.]|uniref:lysylphosphatidylglycerol synthase transmembrane domain-containing protein n=1 Tax=uncultured Roseobacter sp. TaxID=114847 RepID=UPI0034501F8A